MATRKEVRDEFRKLSGEPTGSELARDIEGQVVEDVTRRAEARRRADRLADVRPGYSDADFKEDLDASVRRAVGRVIDERHRAALRELQGDYSETTFKRDLEAAVWAQINQMVEERRHGRARTVAAAMRVVIDRIIDRTPPAESEVEIGERFFDATDARDFGDTRAHRVWGCAAIMCDEERLPLDRLAAAAQLEREAREEKDEMVLRARDETGASFGQIARFLLSDKDGTWGLSPQGATARYTKARKARAAADAEPVRRDPAPLALDED